MCLNSTVGQVCTNRICSLLIWVHFTLKMSTEIYDREILLRRGGWSVWSDRGLFVAIRLTWLARSVGFVLTMAWTPNQCAPCSGTDYFFDNATWFLPIYCPFWLISWHPLTNLASVRIQIEKVNSQQEKIWTMLGATSYTCCDVPPIIMIKGLRRNREKGAIILLVYT